jgi:hypothetical protein
MSAAPSPAESDRSADSLDLLEEVSGNLEELLSTWYALAPSEDDDPNHAATEARIRGTAGKEILEQAALWLAATADAVRVLRQSDQGELALALEQHSLGARRATAQLDDLSRGVSAIDLRYSDEFTELIDRLAALLGDDLDGVEETVARLDGALGRQRSELRSATFIRGHAPIHPSAHHHRYQDIPIVSRIHALYDRVRSFPGAESTPTSDVEVINRYDPGR